MKAYKGFNKDMTCRGFQYEEGKSYHEDKAELCEKGFHCCEYPLDCFAYYYPARSVYHEAEIDGLDDSRNNGDSKVCGTDIRIGRRLDVAGLIKASFDYIKNRCTNNESGGGYSALVGGNCSALVGGNCSALTGGYQSALTGGGCSALTGGDRSALTGGGHSALMGGEAAIMRGGPRSKFKGSLWAVFACEIRGNDNDLIGMATAVVDGENIKPDVWYECVDGEFAEVKEDE